jgi:hypothetical protein
MVQNLQEIWQTDFSGGVNDRLKPDALPENQCVTIRNMLPSKRGKGMVTRGGTEKTASQLGVPRSDVLGSLSKTLTSGEVVCVFAIRTGAKAVDVSIVRSSGAVHTITGTPITLSGTRAFADSVDVVSFCDWDGDRLFFSDDASGLYTMEIDTGEFAASTIARVMNKNGVSYVKGGIELQLVAAPFGTGLVQHRGRLWLYHGSTVYFCGTDDSQNGMARWENWLPYNGTDLAQTKIDDGNSMVVMPYGDAVTGLSSTYNGLVVYKSSSISIWSYPDAAAPWEVGEGASIEELQKNVGCSASATLANSGSRTLFVGQNSSGEYTVFSFDGQELSDVGGDIPVRLADIASDAHVTGTLHGDYYILSDRDGFRAAMNTDTGAWFDMVTPDVSCPVSSDGFVVFVSEDGFVSRYPSGYTDFENPIEWLIGTAELRPKGEYGEFKSRQLFLEVGSVGSMNISYAVSHNGRRADSSVDATFPVSTSAPKYDSGEKYDSGVKYGGSIGKFRMLKVTLNDRAYFVYITVGGSVSTEVFVSKLGFGYRGRTGKT